MSKNASREVVRCAIFRKHPNKDVWQVLVLRRSQGNFRAGYWELVGGNVDPGDESPEAAIRREIEEETGLVVLPQLKQVYEYPVELHEHVPQYFFACCWNGQPIALEPTEHDRYQWLDVPVTKEIKLTMMTEDFLKHRIPALKATT